MKVVALFSGGKDSCYNIMKCLEYGHQIVCLANLTANTSSDVFELNSFMYQCAGQEIISTIAECLNIPLIRKQITRKTIVDGLYYEENGDDEIEDMFELLQEIKLIHPDIEGVSCGAILSNYQRLRVENVSHRLGLIPLAFLWQRNREELLQEILESGIRAILVKVAGAGLSPEKHLGKELGAMAATLKILHAKYGLDICGEGGEYESLVTDCPLFKKKIIVKKSHIEYDEGNNSDVGNLIIDEIELEDKCDVGAKGIGTLERQVEIVGMVEGPVEKVSGTEGANDTRSRLLLQDVATREASQAKSTMRMVEVDVASLAGARATRIWDLDDHNVQSRLLYPHPSLCDSDRHPGMSDGEIVQLQLRSIFQQVRQSLHDSDDLEKPSNTEIHPEPGIDETSKPSVGKGLECVSYVHLYLSDMDLFGAVNREYDRWFGSLPASRSTVAVPLPSGVLVMADVTVVMGLEKEGVAHYNQPRRLERKQVLHVRTQSEWAPLCIGPYAQANIVEGSLIMLAGQIALDPVTMAMSISSDDLNIEAKIRYQLYLSCRHVSRLLTALDSSLKDGILIIIYVNESACQLQYSNSVLVWFQEIIQGFCAVEEQRRLKEAQVEETREDSWKFRGGYDCASGSDDDDTSSDVNGEGERPTEASPQYKTLCPVTVVGVGGLPRDAVVEVEFLGLTTSAADSLLVRPTRETYSSNITITYQPAQRRFPPDLTMQFPFWNYNVTSYDWEVSNSHFGDAGGILSASESAPPLDSVLKGDVFEITVESVSSASSLLSAVIRPIMTSCNNII